MSWTANDVATLRRLWAAGKTTREIARTLGVTRNAVIGKANRLHLTPRPSPIIRYEPER